jgi:hypothetical protein
MELAYRMDWFEYIYITIFKIYLILNYKVF